MIPIKNIVEKDLEIPFEGWTYFFPKGKAVLTGEILIAHLKELCPMAFEFNVQMGKKEITTTVKREKTPAYVRPAQYEEGVGTKDMKIAKKIEGDFGGADITPPAGVTDKDGVGWYGSGIELTDNTGKVFN